MVVVGEKRSGRSPAGKSLEGQKEKQTKGDLDERGASVKSRETKSRTEEFGHPRRDVEKRPTRPDLTNNQGDGFEEASPGRYFRRVRRRKRTGK